MTAGALDETGQEKHGACTAGVKRQYLGCAGRVANGINTVHLAYVREGTGHALIGARQWIPREHISDPVTSLVTGLPAALRFRTKGQLAIDICADAYANGVSFDFICGDEVYGSSTQLREFLEDHGQAYVLRVASSFPVTLAGGMKLTCAQAVKQLVTDRRQWEVRSAGQGSKGRRWYAWAQIGTASPRHHLLVRRHLASGELPGSPGALLHRGPLRTVHATRRGTRPKQATWAVQVLGFSTGATGCRRRRLQVSCTRCVRLPRAALGVSWWTR